MAKEPSIAVERQAGVYRELSDDAIAQLYTKEQLTALPSMTIRDALTIVMEERGFGVKLSTQYKIVRKETVKQHAAGDKSNLPPDRFLVVF